jgi:hypothetical protein
MSCDGCEGQIIKASKPAGPIDRGYPTELASATLSARTNIPRPGSAARTLYDVPNRIMQRYANSALRAPACTVEIVHAFINPGVRWQDV